VAAGQEGLAPVLVGFAGPARQSRLTVLFRLFMVIPQFIVLALLGIAAYVVVIIGWFGALFTGRLPAFAADFLTGYLRWQTRVSGYSILLTDAYPPFSLEDADYPIRVATAPGQLNRLAVLFRLFLLIPCWIVQAVVTYGAFTIVQLVNWLIVLISGQMPAVLHQALAAVLRFQARVIGFAFMLTSAYPAGLFGDPQEPGTWSPAGPSQGYGPQAGFGAQPRDDVPQADAAPLSWRLVLSSGARKLVGLFIVLGVVFSVTISVVDATAFNHTSKSVAAENQLQADIVPVRNAINTYSARLKTCKGQLACVAGLDRDLAARLNTFAAQVRAIPMPSAETSKGAASLASSATQTASIFAKLGAQTNPQKYIKMAESSGINSSVNQLNEEYLFLGGLLAR
jgi:hypothetical protein